LLPDVESMLPEQSPELTDGSRVEAELGERLAGKPGDDEV